MPLVCYCGLLKDKLVFDKKLVGANKTNTNKITVGVDRISNLPYSILVHILSFLSTEEAIHTCILSKTWKYIWTAIPILEFDFEKFCHDRRALDGNIKEPIEKIKEYKVKYVRFVEGIMLNREALLLDKFKLHWFECIDNYQSCTPKSVTELIPHALKFKPRVLSVEFLLNNCENLNEDSIFTCDSLEDVHLSCDYDLNFFAPNSINLPRLKKLELLRLAIGSDFLIKAFLGCPVLEELTLRDCALYFDKIDFNILKKLTIVDCAWKRTDKLEICTPSLLHLDIEKCIGLKNVSARNMPSLVDATIEFGWYMDDVVIGREPNFLGSLSNVTSLHVIVECEIKLKNGAFNCPTFSNLKSLSISWKANYNFDLITFFLHNSPNLEGITILLDEILLLWGNASPNSDLEEPKDDLSPREHLEMVTIVNCCKREITSETIDLLVKHFYAHVRTIGNILIPN